jgi:stress response protein YsnF
MDRLELWEGARVIGADGAAIGTVDAVDTASQSPSLVVRLDDGETVGVPADDVDIERSTSGEVVLAIAGSRLLRSARATALSDEGHMTIPLAAEELVPRLRRERKGRVLIHKRVETHPVEEQVELEHEVVDIERVPVGRDVDDVPRVRQEGDTTVVPVVEEVLVIEKHLRLVEEVRITRRVETGTETVRDELRREVIEVEEERESDRH